MKKAKLRAAAIPAALIVISVWIAGCASGAGHRPPDLSAAVAAASSAIHDATNALAQAVDAYNAAAAAIAAIHGQAQGGGCEACAPGECAPGECAPGGCADGGCAPRGTRAAAVVAGLTRVDPSRYGGWRGACPGSDVDAAIFTMFCETEGVPCEVLLNEQATRRGVARAVRKAVSGLPPGGLLILYYSGHGGQSPGGGPEEADGLDETLCLYDGHLVDDAVWNVLCQIPAGVRVWMITDSCNSGTNYRSPRSYGGAARDIGVRLLHWGGCGDGQYSYGSPQGGHFTTALVDAWQPGLTYEEWFRAAQRLTPATQVPTCEVVGAFPTRLKAFR